MNSSKINQVQLQELFQKIDAEKNSLRDILIELANINSHSLNQPGLNLCRDFVVQQIKKIDIKHGLNLRYEKIDHGDYEITNERGFTQKIKLCDGIKITKSVSEPKALKLLLMGHLDTVYSIDSNFQECKLLDEKTLNGPGVSDLKGGLLVMVKALAYFETLEEAKKISWEIFLNTDEEIGSPGSSKHFAELAQRNELALIFEPSLSDGSIAYRRKGTGNFQISIQGKAAHVGRNFNEGINAIVLAAELTEKLHQLNQSHPNLIINVGKINGGGALNVVPEYAVIGVNVRITENNDAKVFDQEIKAIITQLEKKYPGSEIKLKGEFNRKPKIPNEKTDQLLAVIQEAAKELNIELPLRDTGGCCDGNNLHELGLTNIDTLGVRGGKIHSAEEFVLLDSISERIKLLLLILIILGEK